MPAPIEEIHRAYRDYLVNERVMSPRSVSDYTSAFERIQGKIDLLAEPSYKEVNDQVRIIKSEMEAEAVRKGRKPESARATHYKFTICLRNIARWLEREQFTSRNVYPFSEWKKPRPATPKFLTTGQFDQLLDDADLSHQDRTVMYAFWDCAGRLSEMAALTQQDFFFNQKFYLDDKSEIPVEGHFVRISYEISKGHYSFRNVPISDELRDLLLQQFGYARRRGHDRAIFYGQKNEPLTGSGLSKILHNIGMRQSPLRPQMHLSAHMFRHSFGIRMLERGVPEVIVQKLLGHSSLTMTSHYVNMTAENAMRILAQRNALPRRPAPVLSFA